MTLKNPINNNEYIGDEVEGKRQQSKTAESKTLTTRGRIRRPHQFLLSGVFGPGSRVYPNAVKTQQVFFTGDFDAFRWHPLVDVQ